MPNRQVRSTRSDDKARYERRVFTRFIQSVGLPIAQESVESRDPPEPDILCQVVGHGRVAFELCTLDGKSYRQANATFTGLAEEFYQYIVPPWPPRRELLAEKFGAAELVVSFDPRAPLKECRPAVDRLVDWLANEAPVDAESGSLPVPSHLRPPIEAIKVRPAAGFVLTVGATLRTASEETLSKLRDKLARTYQTGFPVELLAHTDRQPWSTDAGLIEQVQALVREVQPSSRYSRVWIVDVADPTSPLIFVWPKSLYELEPSPAPWSL